MNQKKIFTASCLVLLITVIFTDCNKKQQNSIYAESFTIKPVDLLDIITQTGEVRPYVKVDLKSEASGRIKKVYVKEGQRAEKGQKIVDIDPTRLLNQKERLDLTLKKAQIEKTLAKRDFDNALKLQKTGTVSSKSISDLKSKYQLAEISYNQHKLELNDINDQLSKTTIRSPIDGVVTSLDIEEGEIAVSATSSSQAGTAIATVADISKLEVISQIGEVDYVYLKQGQKVVLRSEAIEGVSTTGTITFIALSAKKMKQEELGTFEVRIAVDSLIPGIAPGINVNVEFVILEKKGVLGVPNHFVKKTQRGFFVQLAPNSSGNKKNNNSPSEQKKPEMKKITIGATDYKHYEILSGLKEGDAVIYRDIPLDAGNMKKNVRRGK